MLHTIIPPESNDAMHLSFLSSYDCAMRSADSIGQAALITWTWPCFYPPSSYLITYLYSLVFGSGVISALTSLTVFIPILVTSIYGINRQRYGVLAGICGVATAAAIPQGLLCCCHYPSDLQVGVGACVTMWALFNCDSFANKRASMLFGLVFGYSLLFKSNVVWFIAPAILVVLLGCWKELRHALIPMLWQAILLIGAALAAQKTGQLFGDLQNDMARYGTFLPPHVIYMLLIISAVCVIWWMLAPISWGRLKASPRLTNLSRALCIAYFIAMPWMMSNFILISGQRTIFRDQFIRYTNIQFLYSCVEEIYRNSFGPCLLIMFAISLIFALTKWANSYDRALAFSAVTGFAATACFLGNAPRYYLPALLISSCCIPAPLKRPKWLALPIIAIGMAGAYATIIAPAYFPRTHLPRYWKHLGLPITIDYPYIGTNSTIFAITWQLCPALRSPDGAPVWLAITRDDKRINYPVTKFGFEPMEDAFNAVITWSAWHKGSVIPFYLQDRVLQIKEGKNYLPFLNTLRRSFPNTYADLHAFMLSSGRDREARQPNLDKLRKCTHYLDIALNEMPALDEKTIAGYMGCPNPAHIVIPGQSYTLHLWSRPECAPSPEDICQPSNRFIPYLPE